MATATATKSKPRLKNLDDLFLLNGGVNPLDHAPAMKQQAVIQQHSTMAIEQLTPFKGHPFRLYEGERLNDMVESIKKNGVLMPVIVRHVGNLFEILSGHNRVNAAKLAGMNVVPVIVLENISDADAWVYVIETNLMQRSFADMAHSEKAAVIATHHSKLFSQGKRNDILSQLRMIENPLENGKNQTSVEISQKLNTRESLAKEYGLKSFQVAQYIRVFQLIAPLKHRLDNSEFAVTSAVTLSFLPESQQNQLDKCIKLNSFRVDMKKADLIRQYSEKDKLDDDNIYLILSGEAGQKAKAKRTPTVKVGETIYAKYFRPDQPAKEVQEIVEKALALYFNK